MYKFVDTTESQSGSNLPSEALEFNGKYIEEMIPGYRTLHVSGREMIGNELTDMEVGITDGSRYQYRRYLPRTITVTYQLMAETNEKFRAAFNKLNEILSAEEARLIFRDEPDKYFNGTRADAGDVPTGTNNVIGEFDIYCADPFKYSTKEYEVTPNLDNGLTIGENYHGTYKAFPTLVADVKSSCGFVAFLNEREKILQIGDVDELDGKQVAKSQTLLNHHFNAGIGAGVQNAATTVKIASEHKQIGSCTTRDGYLFANDYGSGSAWHGPSLTFRIPEDSNGHVGAKNCQFSWHHYFALNSTDQLGVVQFLMTDKDKNNVAAVTYFKDEPGINSAKYHLYVKGKQNPPEIRFSGDGNNEITGHFGLGAPKTAGHSNIQKFGGKFTFNIAGEIYTINEPSLANVEVAEVSVYIGARNGYPAMPANFVYGMIFTSHSVESWQDIPNKLIKGDQVEVNTEMGKVYVNGVEVMGLGALGNDWEEFYLKPGENQIRCTYSSWATKPNFKMKYREVYL